MKRERRLWLLLVAALAGCLKDAFPESDEADESDAGAPEVCAGEADGTSCGGGRLCRDGRCVSARCGDGIVSDGEACDDGNRVNQGDGCDNKCQASGCGNGVVEAPETCDDGNRDDGDACPSSCVRPICGDGVVASDQGEVCDGPRIVEEDGAYGRRGCSADCTAWVEEDACERCQNERCTDYQGVDLVQACFVRPDPELENPNADLIAQCSELVDCALVHGCGLSDFQATECYCGANSGDACTTLGPAADAPCKQLWRDAAKAETHIQMLERFTDTKYATGWAYALLDCYRAECADVCVP
jgi:cysteine-rich repeat protein